MEEIKMEEVLKDAIDMAKDAMEICKCSYEECFPYMAYKTIEAEDGRTYRVKIEIDLPSK